MFCRALARFFMRFFSLASPGKICHWEIWTKNPKKIKKINFFKNMYIPKISAFTQY